MKQRINAFLQVFTNQVEKVGIHPISSLLITQDNLNIKAIANRYSRWVAIFLLKWSETILLLVCHFD